MKLYLRPLKGILLAVLGYLFDVCVMPYLPIADVTGSVSLALIAILIVSYGRKAAFVAGSIIGMLYESMLAGVHALQLLFYPIASMLTAQLFADMSDRAKERRRTRGARRQEDLPAFLRIILGSVCLSLLWSVVHITYCYLAGFGLTSAHITRMLIYIAYTAALTVVLMVPVRAFLGLYHKRRN